MTIKSQPAAWAAARRDRICEIVTRQFECFVDDSPVDGCYAEYAQQRCHGAFCRCRAAFPADKIMDRRQGVSGKNALSLTGFNDGPQGRAGFYVRLPVEKNVQNDVDVDQDFLHKFRFTDTS